jgi:DNA recombination protein RmuC
MTFIYPVFIILLLAVITLQIILLVKAGNTTSTQGWESRLTVLEQRLEGIDKQLREEFRINREEGQNQAMQGRREMAESFRDLQKSMSDAVMTSGREFREGFDKSMKTFNELQQQEFKRIDDRQEKLIVSTEKRLDQMRETVDEKLQKTLNERIGQSFETVGKQLEAVQKGLGEMTSLAQDVGGLKKVLSNVKQRGGIGEVQLAMLLEQMLAPDQFETNVRTKSGSSDQVEFAIRLPGRDEPGQHVYLPIDAKFPRDMYETLIDAYETSDNVLIEQATRTLEQTIKRMAKDIRDKYLDPPHTTDFAIMFLPFEGIYAEVIRRSSLIDQLQREYRVVVTGPTTLTAILNSLQMGFRTLHLQKRSSEVWSILGAVKSEFEKFGGLLEKAQKNISTAGGAIDELIGKRTRAIHRKLRDIEALPSSETKNELNETEEE